jgi:hypothetical protein
MPSLNPAIASVVTDKVTDAAQLPASLNHVEQSRDPLDQLASVRVYELAVPQVEQVGCDGGSTGF